MKKSKKAKGKWPKSGQSTPISQSPPSVNFQPSSVGTKFLQAGSKHNDQVAVERLFLSKLHLTLFSTLDLLCPKTDLLHWPINIQVKGRGFQPDCHKQTVQHWVYLRWQWWASRLPWPGQLVRIRHWQNDPYVCGNFKTGDSPFTEISHSSNSLYLSWSGSMVRNYSKGLDKTSSYSYSCIKRVLKSVQSTYLSFKTKSQTWILHSVASFH